jgi:hypothetical protein
MDHEFEKRADALLDTFEPGVPVPARSRRTRGANRTGPKGVLQDRERMLRDEFPDLPPARNGGGGGGGSRSNKTAARSDDGGRSDGSDGGGSDDPDRHGDYAEPDRLQLFPGATKIARVNDDDGAGSDDSDEELLRGLDDQGFYRAMLEKAVRAPDNAAVAKLGLGRLHRLDRASFLPFIDNAPRGMAVVVHLGDDAQRACQLMDDVLAEVAEDHRTARVGTIPAQVAKPGFDPVALPALLVYRSGDLEASHVRVTDTIGHEFDYDHVLKIIGAALRPK